MYKCSKKVLTAVNILNTFLLLIQNIVFLRYTVCWSKMRKVNRKQLHECINAYLVSAVNMFLSCNVGLKSATLVWIPVDGSVQHAKHKRFSICACKTRSHKIVLCIQRRLKSHFLMKVSTLFLNSNLMHRKKKVGILHTNFFSVPKYGKRITEIKLCSQSQLDWDFSLDFRLKKTFINHKQWDRKQLLLFFGLSLKTKSSKDGSRLMFNHFICWDYNMNTALVYRVWDST